MIKQDINLLPKKKKRPMSVVFGIPFGIILIAMLLAIGILLPKMALNAKQKELDSLEQELASYSSTDKDYLEKIDEFTTLENRQITYIDFTGSKKLTLELIDEIYSIKPGTIELTELEFNYENVYLTGISTNDIDIAKFEVELRKLSLFSEIHLGSIKGPDGKRDFDINLVHKVEISDVTGGTGK